MSVNWYRFCYELNDQSTDLYSLEYFKDFMNSFTPSHSEKLEQIMDFLKNNNLLPEKIKQYTPQTWDTIVQRIVEDQNKPNVLKVKTPPPALEQEPSICVFCDLFT